TTRDAHSRATPAQSGLDHPPRPSHHARRSMTRTTVASVLIVDDEPAVRDIMARWVTSLGLSAWTAASADEALVKLRTERCDLAVVDVRMPGHDGLWLLDELHRRHPD